MSRTVSSLKDGVAGLLTGTSINNVTNVYNALERALRVLLQKVSIPEAMAASTLTVYDGVYDYISPSNIFGGALRDIRQIGVSRNDWDYVYRKPIEMFDRTKAELPNGIQVTFERVGAIDLMRLVNTRSKPRVNLDPMSVTTGWTLGGAGTNLQQDTTNYYESPASLRFTVTGNSTTTLTKTITSQNLTTYAGVGVVFLALQIPSTSLTSVTMKIGSDASNYYSVTSTSSTLGTFSTGDFMLIPFDLSTATTTGIPVITAMDYLQFTITHSATMANVRAGYAFISMPQQNKVIYETSAIFQNQAGTISNAITNDSDIVLLNDAAYNLYEFECAISVGLQMGGSIATGLVGNLSAQLNGARARNGQVIALGLYDVYRANNPAEELRVVGSWYDTQ